MDHPCLAVCLVVFLGSPSAFPAAGTSRAAPGSECGVADRRVGRYQLRVCEESEASGHTFEIRRDGKLVWTGRQYRYFLDGRTFDNRAPGQPLPVPAGTDLNGDGQPEAVVCSWTGGNPGYWTILVFQLGPRLKVLQIINAGGFPPNFRDLDHDGTPEFVVEDSTFRYWPECRLQDQPQVVLRWSGQRYAVAPRLMRKPTPTDAELRWKARMAHASPAWSTDSDALVYALDLMYSGDEAAAREFLGMVWPRPSRQEAVLLKAFWARLGTSPCYSMIRETQTSANTSNP